MALETTLPEVTSGNGHRGLSITGDGSHGQSGSGPSARSHTDVLNSIGSRRWHHRVNFADNSDSEDGETENDDGETDNDDGEGASGEYGDEEIVWLNCLDTELEDFDAGLTDEELLNEDFFQEASNLSKSNFIREPVFFYSPLSA